jgi:hypothetical protein
MEDHLHNKGRLEQEWSALCAYEAEPNETTVATKVFLIGKFLGQNFHYNSRFLSRKMCRRTDMKIPCPTTTQELC